MNKRAPKFKASDIDKGLQAAFEAAVQREAEASVRLDGETHTFGPGQCSCGEYHDPAVVMKLPEPPEEHRGESDLPSIDAITGIDPDFTGDMSTDEYLRSMRGTGNDRASEDLQERMALMQPVVDAAVAWRNGDDRKDDTVALGVIVDAVDAYEAAQKQQAADLVGAGGGANCIK